MAYTCHGGCWLQKTFDILLYETSKHCADPKVLVMFCVHLVSLADCTFICSDES